jgi:hypothetical protein
MFWLPISILARSTMGRELAALTESIVARSEVVDALWMPGMALATPRNATATVAKEKSMDLCGFGATLCGDFV